jgi:hypothetical protein
MNPVDNFFRRSGREKNLLGVGKTLVPGALLWAQPMPQEVTPTSS